MKKPTLLLTGGTGFLGSHLLKRLNADGYSVVLLKRQRSNLRRIETEISRLQACYNLEEDGIQRAFIENKIDIVAHCPTDYGRLHRDSMQIVQANLILPLTVLKVGQQHGLRVFVNTDTLLDKRVSEYSLSKRQFRDWLQMSTQDMVAINIALEHFFGPDDDKSKFVSWIIKSILDGVEHLPLTAGEQRRDFIYIDDVIDAFMVILNHSMNWSNGFHSFEVGTGVNTPIRTVVTEIARLSGPNNTKLDFGRLPYRPNEVMESKVNLDPLKALGWVPHVSLYDGLTKTLQQEKKLRKRKP